MIIMVSQIRFFHPVLFLLVLIYLFFNYSVAAEKLQIVAVDSIQSDLVNPGFHEKPAWFKESFLDLREDVEEAKENNKRVLLYFYQDGCPYCSKLLQDNFGQKKLADKTKMYFDVIAINMWGDKEVVDLQGTVTTEKEIRRKNESYVYPNAFVFN